MGSRYDMAGCVECGSRRRVYHREWLRASAPRCRACGGRVEESSAARKEHTTHDDEARGRRPKILAPDSDTGPPHTAR